MTIRLSYGVLRALCGGVIGIIIGSIVLPGVQRIYSTRNWVDFHSVNVESAVEGSCPVVTVNRTILSPITMSWNVDIDRRTNDGWVRVNAARIPYPTEGRSRYLPGDALPSPMYLPWWIGGPAGVEDCPWLPPGTYRIVTEWMPEHRFWRIRPVEIVSPDFQIIPEDRCAEPDAESIIACLPDQASLTRCDTVRASSNGLFHVPSSPWYDRVVAPVDCFDTPEDATEHGFREAGE